MQYTTVSSYVSMVSFQLRYVYVGFPLPESIDNVYFLHESNHARIHNMPD